MVEQEVNAQKRVDRQQHGRVFADPPEPQQADRGEPDQHRRPKNPPNGACTSVLHREEGQQDDCRQRYHQRLQAVVD